MSAKTKIVVLRMKEIIYTAIFIGFALLLILLFFIMFRPKKGDAVSFRTGCGNPGFLRRRGLGRSLRCFFSAL